MIIERLVLGYLSTNCYILKKGHKALIIDPAAQADKIIEMCQNYKVEEIIVTHHHPDHIEALNELEEYYHLKHNNFFNSSFAYEVIKTPGHTNDSLSIYFKDDKILFSGDFIFYHTIGRCDLETSDPIAMIESLEKIKNYPKETKVYPGHGRPTTLEEEITYFNLYQNELKNSK